MARRLVVGFVVGLAFLAGCAGNPTAPSGGDDGQGGMPGMGDPGPTSGAETVEMSTAGLPASRPSEEVRLENGSTFALAAGVVAHAFDGENPTRAFAYNGQVPGPTLRVPQGAKVTVVFTNALPYPTSVHWHGIRLEQRFDGVVPDSQPAVEPGGTFRYEVTFPDEGFYWYHPHMREDLQQDLGLAGAIVVEAERAGETWPTERVLVIDDAVVGSDGSMRFREDVADHALMGRYGTTLLVNGKPSWSDDFSGGERVRLLIVDVANARPFRLTFSGAQSVDLIALDGGFLEAPTQVTDAVVLSPGERATVDVVLPASGDVEIAHEAAGIRRALGTLRTGSPATGTEATPVPAPKAPHERARASLAAAEAARSQAIATTWELDLEMAHSMGLGMSADAEPIEWEVPASMGPQNMQMTTRDLTWIIRDAATGAENAGINTTYEIGSFVRFRIRNLADSTHPMQHPIHLHGQRFVVDEVDGVANPTPAWKDTVLVPTGSEAVITVEMSNPGTWMFHCHIAEHLEAGMLGRFTVA